MGALLKVLGYIIFVVGGLWGFVISLKIVIDNLGFIGGAIAFFVFPVTFVFAPLYAGIADSNWFPLILNYGSGISCAILVAISESIDRG
jgi:hypothetical protein